MSNSKNGFTLVELSIVLVIIGLLISGILVAQSIIESARISREIRQFGEIDAAVSNFYSRYGQLPGDNNLFNSHPSYRGNNNGRISNGHQNGVIYRSCMGECTDFWKHLAQTGFASDQITFSAYSGIVGNGFPTSRINDNATIIAYGGHIDYPDPEGNFYYSSVFSNDDNAGMADMAPAYTPLQVLTLDIKMDDGIANTGNLEPIDIAGGLFDNSDISTITATNAIRNCVTISLGSEYNIDDDELRCGLKLRLGTTTGQLF